MKPDGVVIAGGPGHPGDIAPVIDLVRALRGRVPMFATGLGHLVVALAYGAKVYAMKSPHRGGNHPIRNLQTGKVEIASQNHAHAIDRDSLPGTGLEVTHINLLDDTVEGVRCRQDNLFAVQHAPEGAPGPSDSAYLFDRFIESMKEGVRHA